MIPNISPTFHSKSLELQLDTEEKTDVKTELKRLHSDGGHNSPRKLRKMTAVAFSSNTQKDTRILSFHNYRRRLNDGLAPNDLLLKAFSEEAPDTCLWLLSKGASIETVNNICGWTQNQREILNLLQQFLIVDPTPDNLDYFAISLGLGYKAANLIILRAKSEELSNKIQSCEILVPSFLPISHLEIRLLIEKNLRVVFELWNTFITTTFDQTLKGQFLDAESKEKAGIIPLQITPEGLQCISHIQRAIIEFFDENAYYSLPIEDWLEGEKPEFLIVRSTGKEDSTDNTNPGGNESIPYVKPIAEEISSAIGQVIASYFSEKSLSQRLLTGDRSIFYESPFLPVLLQVMIGEEVKDANPLAEEIPRGGVIFTEQPERAKGVCLIQAGLGNNEGIVTNQVNADTYFVKGDSVHSVIRRKETRLAGRKNSIGCCGLASIKTPSKELEQNPALPFTVIKALKIAANEISELYKNQPLDIEYTVKFKEKKFEKPVVYLLQARPLNGIKQAEMGHSSYLNLSCLRKFPSESKVNIEIIVDESSRVRIIKDPEMILFVDDLSQGLISYMQTPGREKIEVIICEKNALATSHPAVFLRSKNVVVAALRSKDHYLNLKIRSKSASASTPLLIDTQKGILLDVPPNQNIEEFITKGLISYPIPMELSVPPSPIQKMWKLSCANQNGEQFGRDLLADFDQKTERLIHHLRNGRDLIAFVQDGGNIFDELFEQMAKGDANDSKLALATLLKYMKLRLIKSLNETESFRAGINQPMFRVFEHAITHTKKELVNAFDLFPPQSMERLYPIKFLEALLKQRPGKDVVDGHSYYEVLSYDYNQRYQRDIAMDYGISINGQAGLIILDLLQLTSLGFNGTHKNNWRSFLLEVSHLEEERKAILLEDICSLVKEMTALNALSIWLNVSFNNTWKNTRGRDRVTQMINQLKALSKEDVSTLRWIKEKQSILNVLQHKILSWADQKYTNENMPRLISLFQRKLGFDTNSKKFDSLKELYDTSGQLGRLALLHYLRQAVTIYDRIIKSLEGSSGYSSYQEQVKAFALLLENYFTMLKVSLKLISPEEEEELQAISEEYSEDSVYFDAYMECLWTGELQEDGDKTGMTLYGFEKLLRLAKSGTIDDLQFQARELFSVGALVIGSKTALNYSPEWPARLEEYFTTFHQNLEQIVKFLNTKNGMNESLLETDAKRLCRKLSREFKQNISYLSEDQGLLEVGYQIPLRQHSASITVTYNIKKPDNGIDLRFKLFGQNESKRWEKAVCFGEILHHTISKGRHGATLSTNYAQVYQASSGVDYRQSTVLSEICFDYHLPKGFKQHKELITLIAYISEELTMDDCDNPEIDNAVDLLEKIQNVPGINWNRVGESYRKTLYLNASLISILSNMKEDELVMEIAVNSIIGIAYLGLEDYRCNNEDDNDNGVSLIETSFGHIIKILENEPEKYLSFLTPLKNEREVGLGFSKWLKEIYHLTEKK